jgi:tartrate-resistant acid phosphatase type 5
VILTLFAAALVYIGALTDSTATLVWGDPAQSGNAIGLKGAGLGLVTVEIGGQTHQTAASHLTVKNLQPDTVYPYRIVRGGESLLEGRLRTWPRQAQRLIFFVIGDWGNGKKVQYELAYRMEAERRRLRERGDEVRFVMSVGDNIYGLRETGKTDSEWVKKFFLPYAPTLREIPFYMVAGNHDGNESEAAEDLATQLDNTFTPNGAGQRWFHFTYGNLAEFFALDSTRNQPSGPKAAVYTPEGEQSQWLAAMLAKPALPWRLAIQHHPMFTAGPDHPPFLPQTAHWFNLFKEHGVRAVFSGHEHNLQFSEQSAATGHMLFAVAGSGGQLRPGRVTRKMAENHIAAWAPQRAFLIVELNRDKLTVTPVATEALRLTNPSGGAVATPIEVTRTKQN